MLGHVYRLNGDRCRAKEVAIVDKYCLVANGEVCHCAYIIHA